MSALLGFCGAVIGDNIGFAIGHFGGRPLVRRYGRYIFLTDARLDKATGFFERHGGWIIIVARFVEGLRQANGIIAGISGIHWAKFLLFNAIGAALWVGVWTCVGYFSGSHINAIYDTATPLLRVPRGRRRRAADRSHRPARGPSSYVEHHLERDRRAQVDSFISSAYRSTRFSRL